MGSHSEYGMKLRLQICNRDGVCEYVKLENPPVVRGSVIELMDDEVPEFLEAVGSAFDRLSEDETPWEDNFDLKKLRGRRNTSPER